jgi:hypothetical protein
MTKTWNRRAVLLAAVLVPGAALLAAPERLTSGWPSQPVTIDGLATEWTALVPIEDAKLAVGVMNDDRHLYVSISSSDQARRRQLLVTGLIVWLDAGGGKKRSFGLRFPGVMGQDFREAGSQPGERTTSERETPAEGASSRDRITVPPLTYFELLGPKEDDRRRLERAAVTAIQVGRDMREGTLVFELQVPLAKDGESSFGLGVRPGETIGFGLETPKIERPETPASRGTGGRRPGGMGGRMGGGMGGGGMGGPRGERDGERMERPSTLKLWTTVQLAAASS